MTLNKLTVPIVNPVTLQFGMIQEEVPPFAETMRGSAQWRNAVRDAAASARAGYPA